MKEKFNAWNVGCFLGLAACALLSACTADTEEIRPEASSSEVLSFGTYVDQAKTRSEVADIAKLKEDGFVVFANRTATDWATDGATSTSDFMYNQDVKFEIPDGETEGAWTYAPIKRWPSEGNVSFFAFSPKVSEQFEMSGWNTNGAAVMTYTLDVNATKQEDVIAAASLDKTKDSNDSKVDFNFKHVLSKIAFSAYQDEDLAAETKLEITSLKVVYAEDRILKKADLHLDALAEGSTDPVWTASSTPTYFSGSTDALGSGELLALDGSNQPTPTEVTGVDLASANQINGEESFLMLIPQKYDTDDVKVVLSYKVTTTDSSLSAGEVVSENTDVEISLPKIAEGWETGKQYNYVLRVGPKSVQFDPNIGVAEWSDATLHAAFQDIHYTVNDNTFHIKSVEGFKVFRDLTNGDNTKAVYGYAGVPNSILESNVQLLSDLDFGGQSFRIIDEWYGKFDGNGHVISNITNYDGYVASSSSSRYMGFIRYCNAPTYNKELYYIKDLHLKDFVFSNIQSSGSYGVLCAMGRNIFLQDCSLEQNISSGYNLAGVKCAVGLINQGSSCVLINCSSQANLNGEYETSPLLGRNDRGTMIGCYSISTQIVSTTNYAGYWYGYIAPDELVGCAALYNSMINTGYVQTGTSSYAHTNISQFSQTEVDAMNAAVDTWQTSNPEYTITKKLSIEGGTLHFVDK